MINIILKKLGNKLIKPKIKDFLFGKNEIAFILVILNPIAIPKPFKIIKIQSKYILLEKYIIINEKHKIEFDKIIIFFALNLFLIYPFIGAVKLKEILINGIRQQVYEKFKF